MDLAEISFIILAFFYVIIAFLTIIRFVKLINSHKISGSGIGFYTGLFITAAARTITFVWTVATSKKPSENLIIYVVISIPDVLNICVYLLLILYFFTFYISSHIEVANDLGLFSSSGPKIKGITYYIFLILIGVFLLYSFIFILLTFFKEVGDKATMISNSVLNIVFAGMFTIYSLILSVKFSGRPFRSQEIQKSVRNAWIIVIFWTCARLFAGITVLARGQEFILGLINDITNSNEKSQITNFVWSLVFYPISELIPFYLALNYSFWEDFLISETKLPLIHKTSTQIQIIHSANPGNESSKDLLVNTETGFKKEMNFKDFVIKHEKLQFIEEIARKKNGLGGLFKVKYKDEILIARRIEFDRLSRYDLENFSKDFEEVLQLEHPYLCPLIGICADEATSSISLIYPDYKNKSLFSYLHVEKNNIDFKKRIEIAKKVAIGLEYLHENGMFHGHLSSHNILLDDKLNPRIADFGFLKLKENASIFLKYKNKNSYCSPEMLQYKSGLCNNYPNIGYEIDVYSFGIFMWEMYYILIPFNIGLKSVVKIVLEDNMRPEINKDMNNHLALMIRNCWDADPTKRPPFKLVIERLNSMKLT